jgi:hypothetical protein
MRRCERNLKVFSNWADTLYYPPELEPLFDFCFKLMYEKKQEWHNLYFELCRKNNKYAEKIMQDFSFFQKLCRKQANVEEKVVQCNKRKRESREIFYNKHRVLLTGASSAYERKYVKLRFMPLCTRRKSL